MMGTSGTTNDLTAALSILRGLADPDATAKALEQYIEVSKSIDVKRSELDAATKTHDAALERVNVERADLVRAQAALDAQRGTVTSQVEALKEDQNNFAAHKEKIETEHAAAVDDLRKRDAEHAQRVAYAASLHAATDEALGVRARNLDTREADLKRNAARLEDAQLRAETLAQEYRDKLDAIRKAAGL